MRLKANKGGINRWWEEEGKNHYSFPKRLADVISSVILAGKKGRGQQGNNCK